jgi:tRNA(Ile)-lysidine synthase
LQGTEAFVATLAGARVEADPETVRFLREDGEAARGGLAPLRLGAGERGVWDGRFEVAADRPIEVRALRGCTKFLDAAQRQVLQTVPAGARGGLPLVMGAGSPLLGAVAGVAIHALAHERLQAACGAIDGEPA